MNDYPRTIYGWEFSGYHCRIVETEPGIVHSEQAMDDDQKGRLWLSNRSPMGWQNEILCLVAEIERLRERERWLMEPVCDFCGEPTGGNGHHSPYKDGDDRHQFFGEDWNEVARAEYLRRKGEEP